MLLCVADVGVRVNLSSCETFVDLVLALGRSLQLARNHYNFSFATATEEVVTIVKPCLI